MIITTHNKSAMNSATEAPKEPIVKSKNQSISPHQLEYINECIKHYNDSTEKLLVYDTNTTAPRSVPKLKNFWRKPVYFMDPENQFKTTLICQICKQKIADDGWAQSYRVIDCLKTDAFLVQKKYRCQCDRANFTALDLLKSNKIPDFFNLWYPFKGNDSHLLHDEYLTLIMNDALTGKTFEEFGKTVATYRAQEYLLKRAQ